MIGIGRSVGWFFSRSRDGIARVLVRCRVTPNMLTIFGVVLTVLTGVCMALGVSTGKGVFFGFAVYLLYCCAACDMLDGAVARIGGKGSKFGALLDSTTDRVSDFALWAGLAMGFAMLPKPNLTFVLLCMIAFLNGFMISYIKARAEDLIESCPVGYWQRGERFAAILFGCLGCNPGALVVQQAISPAFTALRRLFYAKAVMEGKNPPTDPRQGRWYHKIQPWYWPRMSLPYDLITLANIAWLFWGPVDPARWDILGKWITG
ncbi:MAG: CDP-alcohol phosphatidyltransferase family protein [Phycisphaerae bacterium]|nr:CDP-alcohol phosphatidyltransferase family protein [Phycisphaerae bacterium]